jgi:hypothetical protein
MKKRAISIILIISAFMAILSLNAAATNYTAMIAQGNTNDNGDCKMFYNKLQTVPSGNTYAITNVGWTYSGSGNASMNQQRATADNLKSAKNYTVLYWSGHGGSNPLTLNETPSNPSAATGTWSEIDVATTLGVSGANWATAAEWTTSSAIRVAIFGACKILDNTYGDVKYLARVMKASNVRVIAGYHGTSPTTGDDTNIAEDFFLNNNTNDSNYGVGVSSGESIRSSWEKANSAYSASAPWAVLCYTSNNNQYYRMPGFPGNTYSAPASNASVYRYRQGLSGNETIATTSAASSASIIGSSNVGVIGSSNAQLSSIPAEIYINQEELVVDTTAVSTAIGDSSMSILTASDEITNRETVESDTDLDSAVQYEIVSDFVENAIGSAALDDFILSVSDVIRDEIDPDEGVVENSETVVGKTYCYSNQYMGVRIADNFIKVGTDEEGVYYFINKWQNVEAAPELNSGSSSISRGESRLTASEAFDAIDVTSSEIYSCELVYADAGNGSYRLSYEIVLTAGGRYFVDCVTGAVI